MIIKVSAPNEESINSLGLVRVLIGIAGNVSVYAVWEFHVPSAWPTLLRMKIKLFDLRNTIRPHVNPKN